VWVESQTARVAPKPVISPPTTISGGELVSDTGATGAGAATTSEVVLVEDCVLGTGKVVVCSTAAVVVGAAEDGSPSSPNPPYLARGA
jgi:hypothetical protein